MPKMRVSISQQGDELKGVVELPGDPAFVLEGLALIIGRVAAQFDVPPDAVVRDLYSLVCGKVT